MTALRERMIEDMRIRNLALTTQIDYLRQISLFARCFGKWPDLFGREDIHAYQLYLTEKKKLSPASISMAFGALRFWYKVTLRRERVTAALDRELVLISIRCAGTKSFWPMSIKL